VLVALEKIGPWRRGARLATASVLIVLAVAMLAAPREIPGFVVPSPAAVQMSMSMN
jgi:hypothetical protein